MYIIAIKHVDDRSARQLFRVSADTLIEAERYVIGVLQEQFCEGVVLVYTDDLIYHVYGESGTFLGVVQIWLE